MKNKIKYLDSDTKSDWITLALLILFYISSNLLVNKAYAVGHKPNGHQMYYSEWSRLKHQAEKGDPHAQFQWANTLCSPPNNSGISQNYSLAATWYYQSALRGYLAAQHNLGLMFLHGQGVSPNSALAYSWFMVASENEINDDYSKDKSRQKAVELSNRLSIEEQDKASEYIFKIKDLIQSKNFDSSLLTY